MDQVTRMHPEKPLSATNVVPFVQPAEKRQARYYKVMLEEQRAKVAAEIAGYAAARTECQESRDSRGIRRFEQKIAQKRREEYELDCLRDALDRRFFPSRAGRPTRQFDIEINRRGSCWRIRIPALHAWITAGRRQKAEMLARQHIAVVAGLPIAGVAVQVVTGSPTGAVGAASR